MKERTLNYYLVRLLMDLMELELDKSPELEKRFRKDILRLIPVIEMHLKGLREFNEERLIELNKCNRKNYKE